MSEKSAEAGSGPESNGAAIDPAALALALAGAGRDEANAFLRDQRAFIADQRQHLHEQLKQIHLDIFEKWLGVALRLATLCVGVAVAGCLGFMIWNAAHDDGLVIEAFSVPPDLAARGLTGQVVASELLENLSNFQARSPSVRAASSYVNNWGDDIKVEIPETGISVGELNRFLHTWLGHQTYISGAVYRKLNGIAVTARVGSDITATATGGDGDLDQLLEKTSETIYHATQPYRFAQYLWSAGRVKESFVAQKELVANGTPQDRYWADNGLVTMYAALRDVEKSIEVGRDAIALRPDSAMPYYNLARAEMIAQHDESALANSQTALRLKSDPDVSEQTWARIRPWIACLAAGLQGDYTSANEQCRQAELLPDAANARIQARLLRMSVLAGMHDASGLAKAYADLPPTDDAVSLAERAGYEALNELALGHASVLADNRAALEKGKMSLPYGFFFTARNARPTLAYAVAMTGDFSGAHAEIDKTPADCGICLRTRARIATLEKNWAGADYWFARAVGDAPSVPFAYTDWGMSLLARGKADDAIAQFKLANGRGPHFADPLEGWGEALMAKNRSDLALAKFEEANKYAPNWGRLHMKWGEALTYAGKKDEAKAQFARAAQLDLTSTEKVELAQH